MNAFAICCICVYVFVLCIACTREGFLSGGSKKKVLIQSTVDRKNYLVLEQHSNQESAANIIAEINQFAKSFLQKLHDTFIKQKAKEESKRFEKGVRMTKLLFKRWREDALSENHPDDPRFTSYTFNKGEKVALCLREQKSGQFAFHDLHLIKFVFLHELTHVATPDINNNHGVKFMSDFKFILMLAKEFGLYEPVNYAHQPVEYCTIKVTYNPYFDQSLDPYA